MLIRLIWRALDVFCNKTFAFLNLGLLGVFISFLLYGENPSSVRLAFVKAVIVALLGLMLIVGVIRGGELILFLLRAHSDPILGRKCDFTWEFQGNDGTLVNNVFYHVQNLSFSEQRTMLCDADGFAVDHEFRPSYTLLSRSVATSADIQIIGGESACTLTRYKDHGGGPDIHQAQWSVTVDPPLHPFESVQLLRRSTDHAVEKRAFEGDGTQFIVRCRHHFRRITMSVVAPHGYRFADVETAVDDQAGKPVRPRVAGKLLRRIGVKILEWEIPYPGTDNRYKLGFRLISL